MPGQSLRSPLVVQPLEDIMFKLTIKTHNAAFHDENESDSTTARDTEIARILREVADRIERSGGEISLSTILDINGRTVGTWSFE